MKLHVLSGPSGEVLATFTRTPNATVSLEPDVEQSARVEEVDAADEYARDLAPLYQRHDDQDVRDQAC